MSKVFTTVCILLCLSSEGSAGSALACRGDRLSLTCTGTGSSQQWTVYPENTNVHNYVVGIVLPNTVAPPLLTVNHVPFHFSITSTSPLTSTVVIDSVTTDANGIRLVCDHSAGMSTSYTINVVTNATSIIPSALINEQYGADNVTVTLEWTKQQVAFYNISVTPDTVVIESSDNSRQKAQLRVAYNITYSVKTVASLCGHNATNVLELLYVMCDYPLELSANVVISGYSFPALVGSNINISCLNEDVPTSPNTSATITCVDNGQWAPDPRQLVDNCYKNSTTTSTSHSDGSYSNTTTPTVDVTEPNSSDVMYVTVTGGALGGFIIILIAGIVLVISIAVISKKGMLCEHKEGSIASDSRDINTHQFGDQNCYQGQYSLLQHIAPRQDHDEAPTGEAQTLVYADLGPLSLQRQNHIIESAPDDNRVEYAHINTKVSAKLKKIQPVSAEQCICADDCLNLDSLLIQIKPDITPHWYKFGKVIGVDNKVLDKCLQYPAEESIIEVCDHWLRNHTGQLTWREVAEALRQISFPILASEVEQIYETGKLPKEEDMPEEPTETPPPIPPKLM